MSKKGGTILVPIGFSDQSIIAMHQAMNLARIKGSEVVLLSVIESSNPMLDLFISEDKDTVKMKNLVKEKLDSLSQECSERYSVEINTMVGTGYVYEKICEIADLIDASLIVMGTNGAHKGITRRFIGSNAEKVVRSAKCPVITIKGKNHRDGCNNILLPLDLAKETKEKVTYAIEYARYWDSNVRLVSVVLKDNIDIKNKLQRNLDQVEKFILDSGVRCTSDLFEAEHKRSLLDVVLDFQKSLDADLIMIMTKKEESLSDSLSVTARSLIYNSDIPVMSIHPKSRRHIARSTIAF